MRCCAPWAAPRRPTASNWTPNLTQTDLAGMVGASRQSVNQILQGFARRGYLQVRGRRIVVQRLDLLRRRAGLDPVSGG
jgi:Crp-like helix-turn-helix domain